MKIGDVMIMNENRIESMLSQLISMVGSIQTEQQAMKSDIAEMKSEIKEVKQQQESIQNRLEKLETISEERHKEILERFESLERDQDFIWEKTARNEREIGNIKRQMG